MERLSRPRYEYRVFGSNLQNAADRLARYAETSATQNSDDTYIVSRLTVDFNVKLRGPELEIKRLEAREGLFELWAPVLRAELPVRAEVFVDQVAPSLGVEPDLVAGGVLRADDILKIVNEAQSLAAIRVQKVRTKLTHEDGLSEFVELSIAGNITQSAAIEALDFDVAQHLLEMAQIANLPNESYPVLLQKLIFA